MEAPKTAELSVLQHHVPEIRDAIAYSSSIQKIADELMAKSFIDPKRERDIMEHRGLSPSEKSRLLVNTVIVQVQVDPNQFQVFICILEERPSLKKLAAKLQEEYKNLSTTPSPTLTQQDSDPGELMVAAQEDHTETAEPLLKHAADINMQTKTGETVLIAAARNGHTDTVQLLLASGADVNQQTMEGITALYMACLNGHTETVRLLLDHSADVNQKTLGTEGVDHGQKADRDDPPTDQERLGERRAGEEEGDPREVEHPEIIGACVAGNLEEVLQCLILGVDVNAQDEHDQSPLIVASRHGHVAIAQALLERGADIHAHDEEGVTPLMVAAQEGHTETAELLLKHAADTNMRSKTGETVLIAAARNGHRDTVQLLLASGADVNQQTMEGFTPLIVASQEGHTETAELLLKHSADVNMLNKADSDVRVKDACLVGCDSTGSQDQKTIAFVELENGVSEEEKEVVVKRMKDNVKSEAEGASGHRLAVPEEFVLLDKQPRTHSGKKVRYLLRYIASKVESDRMKYPVGDTNTREYQYIYGTLDPEKYGEYYEDILVC